jgi:hypothetical protein
MRGGNSYFVWNVVRYFLCLGWWFPPTSSQPLSCLKVNSSDRLPMNVKTKLFLILWFAGLAGVFSFLLVDLSALLAILPAPPEAEIPPITSLIRTEAKPLFN